MIECGSDNVDATVDIGDLTGLGPDAASSGFMAQVIAVAIELGGMPVPRGGGVRLVEALAGKIGRAHV